MFHEIDVKNWPRGQVFYYFSQMAPTGYSLTVEIDATNVLRVVKARGYKFFPAYLWLVTRNVNRQQEFTTAVKDGVLGYYDTLTPLYASWHEDTRTFSFMWTEFSESFEEFHAHYLENQRLYGSEHGVLCQPGVPPENAYTVSALPWVNFLAFSVQSFENKPYYFPSIEAGKYVKRGDRVVMPLSLTCHHATTDGYHVATFLEGLQRDIDSFEDLLAEGAQ